MKNTRKEFLRLASDHKIICFGAGKFLEQVAAFLHANQLRIDRIVDSSKKMQGKVILGCEVQKPDILEKCDGKENIIFISSKHYAGEISAQINEKYPGKFIVFRWPLAVQEEVIFDERLWNERVYGACLSTYKEIAKNREDAADYIEEKRCLLANKKKLVLPRTPLMITTRCTLCCRECSNLMPYYSSPRDFDPNDIIQWIRNISGAVDEWVCCELVGGEPFLHRGLGAILSCVLEETKIQQIEFTTNASVIPKPDILRLMVDERVLVNISEYPKVINSAEFIRVLSEYGIHYRKMENMLWVRTKNLEKRNRSRNELQSQYLNCGSAKMCRTILNGKLYVCSKAASLAELGKVNCLEHVDLMEVEHLRDNLRDFLRLTISEACDYCDIASGDEEIIEAATQMKRG